MMFRAVYLFAALFCGSMALADADAEGTNTVPGVEATPWAQAPEKDIAPSLPVETAPAYQAPLASETPKTQPPSSAESSSSRVSQLSTQFGVQQIKRQPTRAAQQKQVAQQPTKQEKPASDSAHSVFGQRKQFRQRQVAAPPKLNDQQQFPGLPVKLRPVKDRLSSASQKPQPETQQEQQPHWSNVLRKTGLMVNGHVITYAEAVKEPVAAPSVVKA